MAALLTPDIVDGIVGLIPESWLEGGSAQRAAYGRYLTDRLAAPRAFAEEAARAR